MTQTAQTVTSLNRERSAAGVRSAIQPRARRMGVARRRRARGRLAPVALLLGAITHPGNGEDAVSADRLLLPGLVIHVVLSLVIWLQGVCAFLVSVATLELAGDDVRAAPRADRATRRPLLAFPCLFAPAFLEATQPELTNYIPIIRHPAYDLEALGAGFGRACASHPSSRQSTPAARLCSARSRCNGAPVAGLLLALICFGVATTLLAHRASSACARGIVLGGDHVRNSSTPPLW